MKTDEITKSPSFKNQVAGFAASLSGGLKKIYNVDLSDSCWAQHIIRQAMLAGIAYELTHSKNAAEIVAKIASIVKQNEDRQTNLQTRNPHLDLEAYRQIEQILSGFGLIED